MANFVLYVFYPFKKSIKKKGLGPVIKGDSYSFCKYNFCRRKGDKGKYSWEKNQTMLRCLSMNGNYMFQAQEGVRDNREPHQVKYGILLCTYSLGPELPY